MAGAQPGFNRVFTPKPEKVFCGPPPSWGPAIAWIPRVRNGDRRSESPSSPMEGLIIPLSGQVGNVEVMRQPVSGGLQKGWGESRSSVCGAGQEDSTPPFSFLSQAGCGGARPSRSCAAPGTAWFMWSRFEEGEIRSTLPITTPCPRGDQQGLRSDAPRDQSIRSVISLQR